MSVVLKEFTDKWLQIKGFNLLIIEYSRELHSNHNYFDIKIKGILLSDLDLMPLYKEFIPEKIYWKREYDVKMAENWDDDRLIESKQYYDNFRNEKKEHSCSLSRKYCRCGKSYCEHLLNFGLLSKSGDKILACTACDTCCQPNPFSYNNLLKIKYNNPELYSRLSKFL